MKTKKTAHKPVVKKSAPKKSVLSKSADSAYERHAFQEFKAAGWVDDRNRFKDVMQGKICEHVLSLLKVFSAEGHSGTSAPYEVQLFQKLAAFEPVVPLTGEEWEWIEYAEGRFQNKRGSTVFKDHDRFGGQAYDSEGRVFREVCVDPDGKEYTSAFTSKDSHVPVTFPYTPKREYVDVGVRAP